MHDLDPLRVARQVYMVSLANEVRWLFMGDAGAYENTTEVT